MVAGSWRTGRLTESMHWLEWGIFCETDGAEQRNGYTRTTLGKSGTSDCEEGVVFLSDWRERNLFREPFGGQGGKGKSLCPHAWEISGY